MLGLKRLLLRRSCLRDSIVSSLPTTQPEKLHDSLPSHRLARLTPNRFFDLHQLGNKEAIEKERARINDEMNRGYFADMNEFKQHGGKIAAANKVIIPAMVAVKFPDFEVSFSDGKTMKLPFRLSDKAVGSDKSSVPKASLVCLSFRASSQEMINSWSMPFVKAFSESKDVHLYQVLRVLMTLLRRLPWKLKTVLCYCLSGPQSSIQFSLLKRAFLSTTSLELEVSFIDSWLLCQPPIKRFLLWTMKKPNQNERKDTLQKQTVYSFGDHYYFRKELKILNLLTGYIFLLDNFGRVRWQGFGSATEEELSSLLSCTTLLLEKQ